MLNLKELQLECKKWHEHNFPDSDDTSQLLGICEEAGELCHAHLKESQRIRKMDYAHAQMDAVGDMIIFTMNYCNKKGFDIEACIKMAWEEASERDWIKYPENGISK